jgi:hypothetical protein
VDPRSLKVIKASASIDCGGRKPVKCSPLLPLKALDSSFYSRKEGAPRYKGCHILGGEESLSPCNSMAT